MKAIAVVWLIACLIAISAYAGVANFSNATNLTITTGGSWQSLFAAPPSGTRQALWIENPCTSTSQGVATAESLFIGFGTKPTSTTAGGVVELTSCGSLTMSGPYINQQAVWVYAATTSHAFFAAQTQ